MRKINSCHICQSKIPLMDQGEMVISNIDDFVLRDQLIDRIKEIGIEIRFIDRKLYIPYLTWKQLQRCTSLIQSMSSDEQLAKFTGVLIGDNQDSFEQMHEQPLSQLSIIIENPLFVKIIQEDLFQSYMQPIVSTKDQQVYGYEFLLRPTSKINTFSPNELFLFTQHTGMQSTLDSKARINAIKTGSRYLPKGIKQFINFLPSSIYDPQHCLNTTFKAAKEYNIDPNDLVFEVVETEKIQDLAHLKNIFETYKEAGMKVALDDIGSGYSTIEMLKDLKPDYAKIDRALIKNCYQSSTKMAKIKQIQVTTKEMGTTLLAEGIETIEEYNAVQPIVDLVQGYYFGKPLKSLV